MSELRYDALKKTWVILAAGRGDRPSQYFSPSRAVREPAGCPFCPGNEDMTPAEVYSRRPPDSAPDSPGWSIRVVPNKFPALTTETPFEGLPPLPWEEGIHSRVPGFGNHEIVIETAVKNRQMADMEPSEIARILAVYRDRMRTHFDDGRFQTVIVFKNHGREAGASLVHSHTQIIAIPVVPVHLVTQLQAFIRHKSSEGRCLMCHLLCAESAEKIRVVADGGGYLVLAPFAAASPFQLNIVPKGHSHDFSLTGDDALAGLAAVLSDALRRLRKVLGEHPWNMILHNAPAVQDDKADMSLYHWFLEITPRLTHPAGFEMGSGFSINTVAPEKGAALLRECTNQDG